MAKSIRSKRKRMLRNVKRVRYAAKELKRLKDMLGIKDTSTSSDVQMAVADSAEVVNAKDIQNPPILNFGFENDVKKQPEPEPESVPEIMNVFYNRKGKVELLSSEDEDDGDEDQGKDSLKGAQSSQVSETEMDHSQKRVYNRKTMTDQFGNYPPWFKKKQIKKLQIRKKLRLKREKEHQRKIARLQKKKKKNNKRKAKNQQLVEGDEECKME